MMEQVCLELEKKEVEDITHECLYFLCVCWRKSGVDGEGECLWSSHGRANK